MGTTFWTGIVIGSLASFALSVVANLLSGRIAARLERVSVSIKDRRARASARQLRLAAIYREYPEQLQLYLWLCGMVTVLGSTFVCFGLTTASVLIVVVAYAQHRPSAETFVLVMAAISFVAVGFGLVSIMYFKRRVWRLVTAYAALGLQSGLAETGRVATGETEATEPQPIEGH